ncbi:uncharacterized protein BT62DRAFT_1001370 [Guyanagaster necrorhizus]|uniref:Uncharacterized protein n=1 Tax=Guyanagaster necrorhizus TaxID=856835 RepID=A0A9P7W1N5_9AGAR|nr:uncharacterized protein BT62DRAFT_1001370 [Guyanagaster necrorhizus MCA 3950]KAG7450563.1 hypothetical protein BT62DRAFT_1001370 [Guyanagaster necrorhizus MCA 3950]
MRGVFETVGSLGLPDKVTLNLKKAREIFGFLVRTLGHLERALALNETRRDFDCANAGLVPARLVIRQIHKSQISRPRPSRHNVDLDGGKNQTSPPEYQADLELAG